MNVTVAQELPPVAAATSELRELSVDAAQMLTACHDDWQAQQTALQTVTSIRNT